jgi:predicted proteasome-type protease
MLFLDLDLLFAGLAIVALVIFVRRQQRRRRQEGALERTRRLLEENREIDEMLEEMRKQDSPFKKE